MSATARAPRARTKTISAADLFCGAGGTSTGLHLACDDLGLKLDLLAVNHWDIAIETHSQNHTWARHLCADLDTIKPREVSPSGRITLLVASPECQHHSNARGGRPVSDQKRASAWHVLRWAEALYIDNILIENVPEFRTWGPVGVNGRPIRSRKGETYQAFLSALRSLGYRVEDRIINAADYGDPTTRERLFIMARRNKKIRWPEPTHTAKTCAMGFDQRKPWRPAREVIDWTLPGQSIFMRKRPLRPATMRRIIAGLERFGGKELQPFLVVLRNHGSARSVDEPVPAITAGGSHVGLAQPFVLQQQSGGAPRSTDEPVPTIAAKGAIGLVEPFIVQVNHGENRDGGRGNAGRVRSVDRPLPAVTAGANGLGVVEPFIVQLSHGGKLKDVDQPLPTITATPKGGDMALIEPFLVPFYGERDGQEPRTHSIEEPMPTIPASGDGKFGVVQPFVMVNRTHNVPKSVDEPVPTLCTGEHMALVQPFLTGYYSNGGSQVCDINDPMPTLPTKDRFGLVMPVVNGLTLDIHFRMLQPHELAAAMSFPKSYKFAGKKAHVVRQIGNAVPVELARALCRALLEP